MSRIPEYHVNMWVNYVKVRKDVFLSPYIGLWHGGTVLTSEDSGLQSKNEIMDQNACMPRCFVVNIKLIYIFLGYFVSHWFLNSCYQWPKPQVSREQSFQLPRNVLLSISLTFPLWKTKSRECSIRIGRTGNHF